MVHQVNGGYVRDRLVIPFAAISTACDAADLLVSASIVDSVPRFFGDIYRVCLVISCGGFGFEVFDEVGRSVGDFDLLNPYPYPCDDVSYEEGDVGALARLGCSIVQPLPEGRPWVLAEGQARQLACGIVAINVPRIRETIAKLFPSLGK